MDADPLAALLNDRDQYHALCRAEAATLRGPFFTSWPVVTEAAYMLRGQPSAVASLLGRIAIGKIRLLAIDAAEMPKLMELLSKYADQGFDLADATLMYLADREQIETVFTIDRRHFSVYRGSAGQALSLRPLNP